MTEDATTTPKPKKTGALAVAVLVAVVLCAIGVCLAGKLGHGGDQGGALVACENYVKDRLKSPGSAKFSGEQLDQAGDRWTLTGAVDSQNSFGALLRSDFTCVVTGGGDTWTLQRLDVR